VRRSLLAAARSAAPARGVRAAEPRQGERGARVDGPDDAAVDGLALRFVEIERALVALGSARRRRPRSTRSSASVRRHAAR